VSQLKKSVSIEEVIGQHVELKRAGKSLKARCPFHDDKTPSFVVYPEQQRWHCFGACSEGGDVISFVQKIRNFTFREAISELKTYA